MSHNYNPAQDLISRLRGMKDAGVRSSKYNDKKRFKSSSGNPEKIYSISTFETYKSCINDYEKFYTETKTPIKSFKAVAQSRQQYIDWQLRKGYSAPTIKKNIAALCKATGTNTSDLVIPVKRKRADITRNRSTNTEYSRHFSEDKHKELALICRCTGARRADIIPGNRKPVIKGTSLTLNKQGQPAVKFTQSKGGRDRVSLICGTKAEVAQIISIFKSAGDSNIFDYIEPTGFKAANAPIHQWRADYAQRVYSAFSRDLSTLPAKELYYCRTDRAGEVFDKLALREVNINLGHAATRYGEAVNNYLYIRN